MCIISRQDITCGIFIPDLMPCLLIIRTCTHTTRTYIALHHSDDIMSAMASQITGVSIVYSTVCSGAGQRKHQSSASLAFVKGLHRWPVNSPYKGPVTRKMFPFDDVVITATPGTDFNKAISQMRRTKTDHQRCHAFLNIKRNIFKSMLHISALWYLDISVTSPQGFHKSNLL